MGERFMRHKTVRIVFFAAALIAALVMVGGGAAQAQLVPPFRVFDWLTHRGTPDRLGSNGGLPVPPATAKADRVWGWPPTASLDPEIVVGNSLLPAPMFPV